METNKNTENTNKVLHDTVACIIYAIMHVLWKLCGFIKTHGKRIVHVVFTGAGLVIAIPVAIWFFIYTGAWFLVLMFILVLVFEAAP